MPPMFEIFIVVVAALGVVGVDLVLFVDVVWSCGRSFIMSSAYWLWLLLMFVLVFSLFKFVRSSWLA